MNRISNYNLNLYQQRINFTIRMFADFLILEFSLFIGVFLYSIFHESLGIPRVPYSPATFLLPPIVCLPIFYLYGFYTYGRYYRGKHKAIVISQAVSIGFLTLSSLAFFFPQLFSISPFVLIMTFAVNLPTMLAARLWSFVWRWLANQEHAAQKPFRDPKHVLVIGGAGYIGSALLGKLLKHNYKVRLLDLFLFGEEPIQEFLGHPNLEILRGDFRQVGQLVEAIRGVSSVVHLGGIVGDPACALDEELTVEVNLTATRTIAEIAKGYGVDRFIFVSSCSVYGACDGLLDENSRLNPVSLYAKSKIASEFVIRQLSDSTFTPTILRFSTIFGLSGRTRFDLVINLMTANAVVENRVRVFGGDQWRPFLHVDDAAESVFLALQSPKSLVANQVFNVGDSSANKTLQQAGELIQSIVPGTELILLDADGDRRNYRVDFTKINTVLNFKANWTLEAGINQVVEAIKSGRVADYRDPKYSNFLFFKSEPDIMKKNEYQWTVDLLQEAKFGASGKHLVLAKVASDD